MDTPKSFVLYTPTCRISPILNEQRIEKGQGEGTGRGNLGTDGTIPVVASVSIHPL